MHREHILVDFSYDPTVQVSGEQADLIYAFMEKGYTISKYENLVNDKFYVRAVDETADDLKAELKWLIDKKLVKSYLLDYFSFEYTSDLLYLSLLRQVVDLHPSALIEVVPSSKRFLHLLPLIIRSGQSRLRIHMDFKSRFQIPWIYKILNVLYTLLFFVKLLLLKKLNKKDLSDKLLLFGYKGTLVKRGEKYKDTYVGNLQNRLEYQGFKYDLITIETDAQNIGLMSAFNYSSYFEIFKTISTSLIRFIPYIFLLPSRYLISDPTFLNRICREKLLAKVLKKSKAKGVLSYSEFYVQGRLIFSAANQVGVPSISFQHALYDTHHLTTYFSGFHDEMPTIFPNHYLIYGGYSRQLFHDYGFPNDKMVEVGFDRIRISETKEKLAGRKVAFIGVGHNYDLAFKYLLENEKILGIDGLIYRPHPRERKSNEQLLKMFPGVQISDPDIEDLETCLSKVTSVIGFYSTSMLTAMAMEKKVIMYLPQNFLKVHFADYFGIQVVRKLEDINWDQNLMKHNRIRKEVSAEFSDIEILDRWLNLSANKAKS